jgi:hypothetical protein
MPTPPLPERLLDHQRLAESDVVHVRHFELTASSAINDKKMNMTRIERDRHRRHNRAVGGD